MAHQSWEILGNSEQYSGMNSGVAYATKTLTSVSPGANTTEAGAFAFPADSLVPGQLIRVTAAGTLSHKAEAANLTFAVYYGGTAGKALASTAATAMGASALTTQCWRLETITRIISVGEKGKAITQGYVMGLGEKSTVFVPIPEKAPATEIEINTLKSEVLTLGATWSVESAENTLTCLQWLIELLN